MSVSLESRKWRRAFAVRQADSQATRRAIKRAASVAKSKSTAGGDLMLHRPIRSDVLPRLLTIAQRTYKPSGRDLGGSSKRVLLRIADIANLRERDVADGVAGRNWIIRAE